MANVRQRGAFAVAKSNAPLDLVTQNPIFRDQIFVAQQQFLIDRPCTPTVCPSKHPSCVMELIVISIASDEHPLLARRCKEAKT